MTKQSWTTKVSADEWQALTERVKTPLYAYDLDTVRAQCEKVRAAFPLAEVRYAMKANANPSVLAVIREVGFGIDAVSPWELRLAHELGFERERVLYTPSFPSDEDLDAARKYGVVLNADSPGIFQRYAQLVHTKNGTRKRSVAPVPVALRVDLEEGAGHHPHVVTAGAESKFGLTVDQIDVALDAIRSGGLKLVGVHQHIGSGLLTNEHRAVWLRSAERLFSLAKSLERTVGALQFIDIGGGFGVAYQPEEHSVDLDEWAKELWRLFVHHWPNAKKRPALVLEPGRYLVAESGVVLTRVTTIKRTKDRVWVGVDAGMHTLIRPAMYGSFHPVWSVVQRVPTKTRPKERCFVVGPICESGDVLASERMMVVPSEGELLLVGVAGAYGYSMASTYNLRPLPTEVAWDHNEFRVVRRRSKFRMFRR